MRRIEKGRSKNRREIEEGAEDEAGKKKENKKAEEKEKRKGKG